ncbi:MAG: type I methionyl aminopeptidase [Oscillospiraceae bacterium]|jgi:methionyl aminopeptidase|nr:type I methionyl aminopeptidase [Oscillospiraceae bacterium]
MIPIKTSKEIEKMRAAGRMAAAARKLAGELIRPGVTTKTIDREVRTFLKSHGAIPSFLGYNGFPAGVCISVNEEVIHGIPGSRKLLNGDIVSIDVGAIVDGYHGDCASTFVVGDCLPEHRRLIEVCRGSFFAGLEFVQKGCRIGDISHAVQQYAESNGFSVVRDYVGHGVGRNLHEDPEIPNFADAKLHGPRLMAGMTLAIEPMVNLGVRETYMLPDKWTVVTKDGKCSAHYENTVLVTESEPEILTPPEGDGFV